MAWIAALQGFVVAALSAYICNGIPPFLVFLLKMSHRDIFKIYLFQKGSQGKRSCSLSLENLSIFSPFSPCAKKHGAENFAVCGQRPGLLALDLASIFEKLLDQKTLLSILRHTHDRIREQKSGDCRWFPALPAFLIDNQFSLTKSLSVFLLLYCLKTLFQVCQDIVNMLDTDGQTNGGRCDAGCQQFFLCHL